MSPSRDSEYASSDKEVLELEHFESVNMYCLRFWKPDIFEGAISYHECVIGDWEVDKEEWFNSETAAKRRLKSLKS
jgi:hypothetical protein